MNIFLNPEEASFDRTAMDAYSRKQGSVSKYASICRTKMSMKQLPCATS